MKETRLTIIERKVADYIFKNYSSVWSMRASDIASELNISNSSVVRLSKTLGYNGYGEMMHQIQEDHIKRLNQFLEEERNTPAYKFRETLLTMRNSDVVSSYLINVDRMINGILNHNRSQSFEQARDLILRSKMRFIVGFYGCRGIADMLSVHMKRMMPNCISLTHADADTIPRLLDLTQDDCIIIFSFERYAQMAMDAAKIAMIAGAHIIAITDKITSPIAEGAEVVLLADVKSGSFFNSSISQTIIAELLVIYLSLALSQNVQERLYSIDDFLVKHGLF